MPRPLFSHVLNLRESSSLPIKFTSTTGTITTPEKVFVVDTTAGSVTLTLPPTPAVRGHFLYFVKKVTANSLVIQSAGSDLITYGGLASVTLNTRDADTLLLSDGAGTWIKLI